MRRQHQEITLLSQTREGGERQAQQGQSIAGPSGWHSPGRSTLRAQRSTIPGPFSSRVASLLVLALAIGSAIAHGATYVGGPITSDTTWTTAGSPYIVQSDVIVAAESGPAPVLTIQPSVQVRLNAGTGLYIGSGSLPGKLYAVATSSTRITFTANGSTQRGFHNGVFFDDGTDNTSQLVYCNIYYGGGANPGNVTVNACNITIKNCNARYSSTSGIYLENTAAPVMSANSISYCTGAAMSFDSSCRVASVTSITGSATNGTNAAEARGGDLTGSNETWRKLSIPFLVQDRIMVYGSATTTTRLTISAGATLRFANAGHLVIGSWDDPSLKAALYCVGTSTKITKLTSAQATPAPGDFPGLILLDGVVDASTSIQFTTLEFGGRGTNAGIWLYACSPTIKNSVTVRYTAGNALFMLDSASTITGVTLANNTQYGIRIEGDAARAANLSAITFSGNGKDAVEYARAEIRETSETLPYLGTTSVYDLPYGVAVHGVNSTAAKLTIANAVTLRCLNGSSLSIGNDLPEEPGILVASGTSALPIVIEGSDPSPGNWGGLQFRSSVVDASTVLDYLTARYATTGFYLSDCSPTIRNSTASSCSGSAIVLGGACAPVISAATANDNGGYPLELGGASLMSGISGLTAAGNGQQSILYNGRELTGSGDSLPNLGLPYEVQGSIVVRGNQGESPLLRLAAGVEMRFPEHERLVVGGGASDPAGALEAIGTPSQPILLHSQTGVWAGVLVDSSSLDSSTHLSYVTVAEGGQDDAALYIAGSSPVIDNLTIS
ncbi:MAG: right-handed parallel beta-helix repeat-containing protein, partial [Acidobacteria bacterium]|nr:right-handed parallel beta-helix repeat-containing protein [Acidobacteriota bacterium]